QAGRSAEVRDPGFLRGISEELIDLVEGFHVIRHERDRDGEDLFLAAATELVDDVERGRAEPLDRPELRLVSEGPGTLSAGALADGAHARLDFPRVRVAFPGHERLRDRVRGEEEVDGLGTRVGELRDLDRKS